MQELLSLPGRRIYLVPTEADLPAVYYLVDRELDGVLINTPPFAAERLTALQGLAPLRYIFLPSRFGAHDLDAWREASGAEALAYEAEVGAIAGHIDLPVNTQTKFTRTIDFLPMSGRTEGSCALRLKNKPGVVFFGPILSPSHAPGADGWPSLEPMDDDHSYESRLFGALGLQDIKYEYAFTDRFEPDGHFGPGADQAIGRAIELALGL